MRQDSQAHDHSAVLIEQVCEAIAARAPLFIRGGGSKPFPGRQVDAAPIDTRAHRGIVNYDPTELVITVRAGTPVSELDDVLDDSGQMLPCEVASFGGAATVGGMVASGLAGPRRPWVGSVRDFVLGCRLITGQGRHLRFGGEVMKNVAGYDVSRLVTGSFGCLGLLTEVSLKVLPKPRATRHIEVDMPAAAALTQLAAWRWAGLPIAGACHDGATLHLRLEGGVESVRGAHARIGGAGTDSTFWRALREQRLSFFDDARPLWRLSVPPTAPLIELPGPCLIDWGGAQRWLKSDASAKVVRELAQRLGGHATGFSAVASGEAFHPLPAALMRYHRALKQQLDPYAIFNPGRLYADF
ncbi:glycolate oxidase subunit GlcE [Paraburkholderia youngii]|uniref:Glycolate oxidase subunit GlcE n=1 Tax=Paraburkholderia youngii TaxID=2782701 RepID=A0A7Y6K0Z5_9BURK|nr:glycolate oxidase subunit GlcE [Paraburkholderia youngii]NUY02411.1 glycolate oxidase subunit GlcE [Paraburkholderia youngii]